MSALASNWAESRQLCASPFVRVNSNCLWASVMSEILLQAYDAQLVPRAFVLSREATKKGYSEHR